MNDVVVVGSGPGGVNASAPLVAAGRRVLMLDYGNTDPLYAPLIPHRSFTELRRDAAPRHGVAAEAVDQEHVGARAAARALGLELESVRPELHESVFHARRPAGKRAVAATGH